jgi:predicted transcriptional regulator
VERKEGKGMKTYNVTVQLGVVIGDLEEDPDKFKEAVITAMQAAIELDEDGDEELEFNAEEIEPEDF